MEGVVAAHGGGDPEAVCPGEGRAAVHRAAQCAGQAAGHGVRCAPRGQGGGMILRRGGAPAAPQHGIAAHGADKATGAKTVLRAAGDVGGLIAVLHGQGAVGLLTAHQSAGEGGLRRGYLTGGGAARQRQCAVQLGGGQAAHGRAGDGDIQPRRGLAGGDLRVAGGAARQRGGVGKAAVLPGGYGAGDGQRLNGRAVRLGKEGQRHRVRLRRQRQRNGVAAAVKAAGENGGERRGDGHILRQTVAAGGIHGGKFRRRGDGLHRIPGGGGQYGRRQQAQRQSAGQQQGCDPLSHGYLSCVLGFTGGSR